MIEETKIDSLSAVLNHVKDVFVGKDLIIDLMGICLVGGENLFLFGPPGTAKSAMVKELAKSIDGNYFEYLLTRFTEPSELFGPFDIRKLRDGELTTNTEGMLPEATFIFLDELLNANSAILNTLLMALNEKVFVRGNEVKKIPSLMTVGASNHLPEDETLKALFDRFLIRVRCDNVDPERLEDVLVAGWRLSRPESKEAPKINSEVIKEMQDASMNVDLSGIRTEFIELIRRLRNAGVSVSDRRAVKLQRLIAASAIICKRENAILTDLWVLKYTWDNEEQIEVIAGIVNSVIEMDQLGQEKHHPATLSQNIPDAENILEEIKKLSHLWSESGDDPSQRSMVKDKLKYLNDRAAWISNEESKAYVMEPINALWNEIVKPVE